MFIDEKDIFLAALAQPDEARREAYLLEACAGQPELLGRVRALLSAHDNSQGPLDQPAVPAGTTVCAADTELALATIGPYKLLEKIGEGGMGTVWMAQQTEPVKRLVAIKLIKAGMDSKQVIARFEAERQALALMDHVNIARVLDAGTTSSGRPYFVMDLVKGMPITRYCDEHHLTPRQRLELFVPVCHAIQHAHQKGIIHRDLKPSNVLIALYDGKPVPKVIDFGVAKAAGQQLTEKTLVTGFGNIVGTLEYMSPEQAELNQLDIDTRSDIYALGVLLYELLAGSPPFTRKSLEKAGMMEMLRLIREQEPSKPSTKLSTAEALPTLAANRGTEPAKLTKLVRGELDWIVMKALEKDRSRRYETANGFAMDIQRYLADEPVLACPPSAGYRLRKFVRRYKGQVLAASLLLLTLVLGIVGTTVGLVMLEEARQTAETNQRKAEDETRDKELARADAVVNQIKAEKAAEAEVAQRSKAEAAAIKEKQARVQAEKRLTQIEKGIEIIGAIFKDLNPHTIEKDGRHLREILGERLDMATKDLEAEAIGEPLAVARLQNTLGQSLAGLGYSEKAIIVFNKSRKTREQLLPLDHADTLASMHNLAGAYEDTGKLDLAIPLYLETLQKRKATLTADHPDTVATMNNLALAYGSAGELDLSLALYRETLDLIKANTGPRHHYALVSTNNLAVAYQAVGQVDRALPLLIETQKLMQSEFGPEHAHTLSSMHNIAAAYRAAGQLDKAVSLHRETLQKRKANLGAEHPDTLNSMNSLAETYRAAGQLDLAVPLHRETLEKCITKLGPNHPDTLRSMNNLAVAYAEAGQFDLAVPLHRETLEKRKAKLGPDHRDTLASMNNLATCYLKDGKTDLAIKLYRETLEKMKAKLGAEDPDTLHSMSELATAYHKTRQFHLALPLYREALKLKRARLSPDHPETLRTMNNFAALYADVDRLDLSLPLVYEAYQKLNATYGPGHPETLSTAGNLGHAYSLRGQLADAEPLLAMWIDKAGRKPRESKTLLALRLNMLGACRVYRKEYADAEGLLRESLALYMKELPDSEMRFETESLLGAALAGQMKYDEAEPLLLKGYQGLKPREKSFAPRWKQRTADAAYRLVQLYDATDKKDDAAKWRKIFDQMDGRKVGSVHDVGDGLSLQGKLDGKTAALVYEVKLTAGKTYLIDMVTQDQKTLDPYLVLQDADYQTVIQDDDGGLGLNACMIYRARHNGVYRIRATFNTGAQGAFTLTVRETLPVDDNGLLSALESRASTYKAAGKTHEAIGLFEQVKQAREKTLGPDHRDTVTVVNDLAVAYWSVKQLDRSIPLFEDSLKRKERLLGRNHDETLWTMTSLGVNYRDAGRLEEALPLLEEAFHKGKMHPQVATYAGEALVDAYIKAGKTDQAATMLRGNLARARRSFPSGSLQLATELAMAAYRHLQMKQYAEAEPLLRECLAIREKQAADLWTTFAAQSMLGEALMGQKNLVAAEPLLVKGYEGLKERAAKIPPESKIRLAEAVERLVRLYEARENHPEAARWRRELELHRNAEKHALK